MPMLIDGKKIANHILETVSQRVAALPFTPVFCDVLVGDDPVAFSYVNIKGKTAERAGMKFHLSQFPADIPTGHLTQEIDRLNHVPNMCGIIVQLPLPPSLSRETVLAAIEPGLDVDCIGPVAAEKFYAGASVLVPPTAGAIMDILQSVGASLSGASVVVVGQGELVGKPVTHMLRQKGLSVRTADRATTELGALTRSADVIICGTGQAGLIRGENIKSGAVIIDAGTAETGSGIAGDVDLASVLPKASFVSPVPGGVGPVTVARLLYNVMLIAEQRMPNRSLDGGWMV